MGKLSKARIARELKRVTVERPRQEVLMEPHLLASVLADHGDGYRRCLVESPEMVWERWDQIDRLRFIAARKLSGRHREIILMLLSGGMSQREIARCLEMSRNTVRQVVEEAQTLLAEHVAKSSDRGFPPGDGETVRTALFPLDTEEERGRFSRFVNRVRLLQIAYERAGDLREALVLYSEPLDEGTGA